MVMFAGYWQYFYVFRSDIGCYNGGYEILRGMSQ
jgi:hypothetical protein